MILFEPNAEVEAAVARDTRRSVSLAAKRCYAWARIEMERKQGREWLERELGKLHRGQMIHNRQEQDWKHWF